ncbi:hypothetical protein HHI36_009610 [Cryptolaemus montrouzieri]|uniref:LisH domain-containing protein n=1 Tax=Cryptolaemus montrouzieri TaxID=559131 RepID=A0ABD2MG92_9CUCU
METSEITHITPAINIAPLERNNLMSPQEFQTTLYYWFNQKGLVSNMRSYLRMKMISVLKTTTIGESLNINANISMENQALNILIADYLFQHRYDYSLSVFSTEVPIKNLVSEFCFFVFNKEKSKARHKIDEENIMCIVESLGISANSELCGEILMNYKKMENASLLLCILRIVMNYYKPEEPTEERHIEEISKVIRKLMLQFDLPMSVINHLIERINFIIKTHVDNTITKLSKNYDQEKFILRAEYNNKESEFKQKLMEVDKFLNEETKKIGKEHEKLVYLTENMVSNERKLAEKSREMEAKLKKVSELELKLAEEIRNCGKNKTFPVQPQVVTEPCKLKHCNKQCEENRNEIEQLKIQKNGFEKISENQNILIANLTAKSNIMYKQLQESMYTIERLKGELAEQQKLLDNERRRKEQTSERTMSSSEALTVGTDGEGDHVIEDAIKQSHLKLEELEKESAEIERKFKQFQLAHRH